MGPLQPSGPHGNQNLDGRVSDPSLLGLRPARAMHTLEEASAKTALLAIQDTIQTIRRVYSRSVSLSSRKTSTAFIRHEEATILNLS